MPGEVVDDHLAVGGGEVADLDGEVTADVEVGGGEGEDGVFGAAGVAEEGACGDDGVVDSDGDLSSRAAGEGFAVFDADLVDAAAQTSAADIVAGLAEHQAFAGEGVAALGAHAIDVPGEAGVGGEGGGGVARSAQAVAAKCLETRPARGGLEG